MLQNVTTKGNKTRACFLETNNDHVQTVARACFRLNVVALFVVPLVSARIEGTENKTPSRRRKRGFSSFIGVKTRVNAVKTRVKLVLD